MKGIDSFIEYQQQQESTDNNEQEAFFLERVEELEVVNKQIARLLVMKESLTQEIIEALDHDHEGQKTYTYGEWKIEVKTPFVFSLDKKKYESGEFKLPRDYNPIKESVSYSIDKRLCEKMMQEAPKAVRETLAELIDKKPGKASVNIKERV